MSITGGCAVLEGWSAALVGFVGGLLANAAVPYLRERWLLDDPVNVLGVHGLCGAWSMLATGIFADPALLTPESGFARSPGYAADARALRSLVYGGSELLGVQVLALLSVAAWTGCASFALFRGLRRFFKLRVESMVDLVGLDVAEHDCGAMILAEIELLSQEKQLERQDIVNQYTNFQYSLVSSSEQLFYTPVRLLQSTVSD